MLSENAALWLKHAGLHMSVLTIAATQECDEVSMRDADMCESAGVVRLPPASEQISANQKAPIEL